MTFIYRLIHINCRFHKWKILQGKLKWLFFIYWTYFISVKVYVEVRPLVQRYVWHRKVQAAGLCFECTYTLSISVHFVHFSSRKNAIVPCHTYDFTVKSLELGQSQNGKFISKLVQKTEDLYIIDCSHAFSVSTSSLKGRRRWPLP